jgi:hypothetical protein
MFTTAGMAFAATAASVASMTRANAGPPARGVANNATIVAITSRYIGTPYISSKLAEFAFKLAAVAPCPACNLPVHPAQGAIVRKFQARGPAPPRPGSTVGIDDDLAVQRIDVQRSRSKQSIHSTSAGSAWRMMVSRPVTVAASPVSARDRSLDPFFLTSENSIIPRHK